MQSVDGDVRLSVSLDTKGVKDSLNELKQYISTAFKTTDAGKVTGELDDIVKSAKKAAEAIAEVTLKTPDKKAAVAQPKSAAVPANDSSDKDMEKRLASIRARFYEIADKQKAMAEAGQMNTAEFQVLEDEANRLGAEIDRIEDALKLSAEKSREIKLPTAENAEDAANKVKNISEELSAAKYKAQELGSTADQAGDNLSSKMMKLQADVEKASEKLALAKTKMEEFENQSPKPTAEYSKLYKEINTVTSEMEKLNDKKAQFVTDYGGFAQYMDGYKRLDSQIAALETKYDDLNRKKAEMEASGTAFQPETAKYQQLSNALQDAERQYEIAKAKLNEYNRAQAASSSATSKANNDISKTGDEAEDTAKKLNSMGNSAKESGKSIRSSFAGLNNIAKKAFTAISSRFKSTAKEGNAALTSINNHLKGGFKTVLKYVIGIGTLFNLLRKLKTEAAEGYKNLAVYSDSVNTSISGVLSVLLQFKNQAAAAFQPLVSVAAPILTQFIGFVNKALFSVSQFFAALTGQDYVYKAVKVQQNYADSLKETAKESKDAKKALNDYLSPLDEISRFTEEQKETGLPTGETGAANPDEMFETVKVEGKFKELADKIKSKIGDLYGYIKNHDWKGLGAYIADDFNSGLQTIKNFISWDNIGDKITEKTSAITEAINSFVDNADWALLGSAIGEGVNTITNTVDLAITGIDWSSTGAAIADSFNGLTVTVDWKKIGSTIGHKMSILPKTLLGFAKRLKWSAVGKALGEGIQSAISEFDLDALAEGAGLSFSGIVTAIDRAIIEIDWGGLAKRLKNGAKKLFGSISYKDIGRLISDLLISALDFTIEITNPFDIIGNKWGEKIGKDFGDMLANINWKDVIIKALQLIGNMVLNALYVTSPAFAADLMRGISDSIIGAIYQSQIASNITAGLSDQLDKGLENVSKSTQRMTDIINNSLSQIGDVQVDMKIIDDYQSRFNELIDKVNLSPEEESELNTIVDYFSKNIDGFSEAIQGYIDTDEQGKIRIVGHMNEIKDKINEVIDSYQRLSMAAALSQMSQDTYKEYIKAQEQYKKQKDEFKELLDLYDNQRNGGWQIYSAWQEANKALDDFNKKMEESGGAYYLEEHIDRWNAINEQCQRAQQSAMEYTEALKGHGIEISGSIENIKDFSSVMNALEDSHRQVNTALEEAKAGLDNLKDSASDYANATDFLKGSYDNLYGALEVLNLGLLSSQEVQELTGLSVEELSTKVKGLEEQTQESATQISNSVDDTAKDTVTATDEMQQSFDETGKAASNLEGGISGTMSRINSTIQNNVRSAISKINELIDSIKNSNKSLSGIGTAAGSIIGPALAGLGTGSSGSGSHSLGVYSAFESSLPTNAIFSRLINNAFKGDIPMLARGAVIPANKEFLAILGDQKQGRNLEAPEGLIRQIIREELHNAESGDKGGNYRFTAQLNRRTIFDEIIDEAKLRETIDGKNPFELS